MLGLPESTEVKQFISKAAIYRKFGLNNAQQAAFDADIAKITIVNEISGNTLKLSDSDENAFFLLEVALKNKDYDKKNIEKLTKLIEQNLLLVLVFEGDARLAVFHTVLHESEWKRVDEIKLELKGLDFTAMWENVIRQVVSGQCLVTSQRIESNGHSELVSLRRLRTESQDFWDDGLSLDENIERKIEREKVLKQIVKLEGQMKKERQPNKKFELFEEIKILRKMM